MDARLADVCIGTSAAPTFLPAHYFETVDHHTGASRSFDVIDGGIVANNPVCFKFIQYLVDIKFMHISFFNVRFP
jgi:patatin-like phospholipase/acyl hydrolase